MNESTQKVMPPIREINKSVQIRDSDIVKEDWIECTLGDIGSIFSGGTPKTGVPTYWGDDISWISPSDLSNYTEKYINKGKKSISKLGLQKSSAKLFPKNTVLFSSRAPIGYTVIANKEMSTNQGFKSIYPFGGINSEYIYYFLKSSKQEAERVATGTTFKEISKTAFSKLLFPLPPVVEQKAIVTKLEELFSSLDSGIADLKKAQDQLVIYRQAVLKKAFEGDYPEKKIIEIANVNTGATPKRGNLEFWKNGTIPWVTSTVVNNPFVNEPSELITENAIKQTNCKIIPKGSLLVAMYGEGKTRGKCAELNIDTATNQALAGITILEEHIESKQFVKWFFVKNYEEIRLLSSGGVQPNLNLSIIKNTVIPFPNPIEQKRIIREIESRLSVCDKVEESIAESLVKAQALRQSILKKAFEGKLLSADEIAKCKADTDYEPASALLKKIKAEKK